jgi:hypothetical protein
MKRSAGYWRIFSMRRRVWAGYCCRVGATGPSHWGVNRSLQPLEGPRLRPLNPSIENVRTPLSRREWHPLKMTDIGKLSEWLRGYDGVVAMDIEGESPTRLRVEFATEERAHQFIATTSLIDGITVSVVGKCTVAIEDD